VGGESLNLQNGSIFCALDHDWVPKTYHQAVGRLARKGQTKPVLPYILVANNSIDDYVLRVSNKKEDIIECSMPPEELSMANYQSIQQEVNIT
jgi:SNF2 family DNA or RNA helicase